MREQVRGKIQLIAQSELWRGHAGWRRGLFTLLWSGFRFWLSQWLWGTGLRLAHFPPPTKSAGAVLALLAVALFIWAAWSLVKAVRALGLKRCAALLVVLFLLTVGFDILTLPEGQSRMGALFRQFVARVQGTGIMLGNTVTTLLNAPAEFSFAYNGTRSPPELPPGFPTPNPLATPFQVVARQAGQALPSTALPRSTTTPVTDAVTESNTQLQVGGFAQAVNTGGKTLQARERPGTQAIVVARFPEGTRLEIIAGPQQADNYTWWQVRDEKGQEGWCADAWLVATD